MKEIFLYCKKKAETLGMETANLVLDHATYLKALDILLKDGNEKLKTFMNLKMGGFHACCSFLAVIGKRFEDAGLKDLITESDLHLEMVLLNKSWRVNNITVRCELLIENKDIFSNWLKVLQNDPNAKSEACVSVAEETINLFNEFETLISDEHVSPMVLFWQPYIKIFELLLQFQKPIKSGKWELHLENPFHNFMLTITINMLVTSHSIAWHNRCYQSHTQRCIKNLLTGTLFLSWI